MFVNADADITNQIQRRVSDFILHEGLLPPDKRLLLAVSGGVDSVVMTDIMHKLAAAHNLSLHIAHLNHNLRGADADRDEAFVRDLAQFLNLQFMSEKHDVAAYAQNHKMSLEEAARTVRYDFLFRAAQNFNCDRIALAHHMLDNAESILLNLMRGAGLSGLQGIRPKRPDGVIRPLLCLDRPEIEAYAQASRLKFVEDHTNASLDFKRNRVRLTLLPEMQAHFNPQVVQALNRLGEIAHDENAWADGMTNEWLDHNTTPATNGPTLELAAFRALPQALARRVLRQAILKVKGDLNRIEWQHLAKIAALTLSNERLKRLDLPDNILVVKRNNHLEILKPGQPLRQIRLEESVPDYAFELEPETVLTIPQLKMRFNCTQIHDKNALLQANALQNRAFFAIKRLVPPLCIRNYRKGDIFSPLGVTGRVKLKKFFINAKVPVHKRKTWPLLVNGNGEILWVIGLRLSNAAQITDDSAEFILVEALLS